MFVNGLQFLCTFKYSVQYKTAVFYVDNLYGLKSLKSHSWHESKKINIFVYVILYNSPYIVCLNSRN